MNELTPMKLNEDFLERQALDKFREIKMRIEAVCTHRNHHVNKALNKLMCRIIKTVMNYQN